MIVEVKWRKPDVVAIMSWQDAANLRAELTTVIRVLFGMSRRGNGAPDCSQLEVFFRMLASTMDKEA